MKKFLLLLFFISVSAFSQTDDCEGYTSNFTSETQGTGWNGSFTPKSYGVSDAGGVYIQTNLRKISGTKTFAMYANNSGSGYGISRSFSAAKSSLTSIVFKVRFDLNTNASKTAGITLNSIATNSQTSWNSGQRLFVGIDGQGVWKYDGTSLNIIRAGNNTTNFSCIGGKIYEIRIDFDVRTAENGGKFGNDKFCLLIKNLDDGTQSDTLKDISLGGTSNTSIASISFANSVIGDGQDLYWDDIVTTDNPATPLPVELTSFTSKASSRGVQLNWQTATEKNNAGFEVQKSSDKSNWNNIGYVAGAGNSNTPRVYSFLDKTIQSGVAYYRLKQIDNDGTFEYSPVTEAVVDNPVKFELAQNYPNPFNPATQISYSLAKASSVKITIFNALGQQVRVIENGTKDAGYYTVTISANDLGSGVYYYKLEAGSYSQMKKMVVLK